MNNIWFSSDTHYFHSNIIKYCKRPFSSALEMNNKLIENWNSVIKPNDTVYHLGDVGFCSESHLMNILDQLNGNKVLILGNHDKMIKKSKGLKLKFTEIYDYYELKVKDDNVPGGIQLIILCHFPLLSWNQMRRGSFMLHGHTHGTIKYPFIAKILDVGVDNLNYFPISYENVKRRLLSIEFSNNI